MSETSFPADHDADDIREMRQRTTSVECLLQTCTRRNKSRVGSAFALRGELHKMLEIVEGWLVGERRTM